MEIPATDLKILVVVKKNLVERIPGGRGGNRAHFKVYSALENDAEKDEKTSRIVIDSILAFEGIIGVYSPLIFCDFQGSEG